jgi:membrane-associated protease RseP (regulator of RpoE activity)
MKYYRLKMIKLSQIVLFFFLFTCVIVTGQTTKTAEELNKELKTATENNDFQKAEQLKKEIQQVEEKNAKLKQLEEDKKIAIFLEKYDEVIAIDKKIKNFNNVKLISSERRKIDPSKIKQAYLGCAFKDSVQGIDSVVYAKKVFINSAAYKVGIKEGDIVLKFNNVNVNDVNDIIVPLYDSIPGEKINLTILRNNEEIDFIVTLENIYGKYDIVSIDENKLHIQLGAPRFIELTESEKKVFKPKYGGGEGIKILEVGGLRDPFKEGVIINLVGHNSMSVIPINTIESFYKAIIELKKKKNRFGYTNISFFGYYLQNNRKKDFVNSIKLQ